MESRGVVEIEQVTLVSGSSGTYTAPREAMKLSQIVARLLNNGDPKQVIVLKSISSMHLERIVEFCEFHRNRKPFNFPKPLMAPKLEQVVEDWYVKFMNSIGPSELRAFMNTSAELEIDELSELW